MKWLKRLMRILHRVEEVTEPLVPEPIRSIENALADEVFHGGSKPLVSKTQKKLKTPLTK